MTVFVLTGYLIHNVRDGFPELRIWVKNLEDYTLFQSYFMLKNEFVLNNKKHHISFKRSKKQSCSLKMSILGLQLWFKFRQQIRIVWPHVAMAWSRHNDSDTYSYCDEETMGSVKDGRSSWICIPLGMENSQQADFFGEAWSSKIPWCGLVAMSTC